MRWKGLILIVVIIILIGVISIFFMDKWIESALEKTGQAITGARVEIDGLDFSLLHLSIEWRRMQVTDPEHTMQNIIETGRTAFRMNPAALLRKRIVIQEMALENLRSGTARAYDGKLPKKIKKAKPKSKPGEFDKVRNKMASEIDQLPVMQFNPDQWKQKLNLDSLIVLADLTLPGHLDSAKTEIIKTAAGWEHFFNTFQPDADLEKIKNDFKDLDPQSINSVQELTSTIRRVQDAQKTLKSIQDTVKTRHQMINSDFKSISGYTKQADDWYQSDYQSILKKAKLPDLSVRNIGMMLFGSTVVHRLDRYLGYVETIRKYMPKKSDQPKKEKPIRGKGQNIYFPDQYYYPTFLIERIGLSGKTGSSEMQPGLQLIGSAAGINNQPWIYGKPTEIKLNGVDESQRTLNLIASLDHTTDVVEDHFEIVMTSISLNNVQIVNSQYLPSTISRGKANVRLTANFHEDNFNISMAVLAHQLQFDFPDKMSDNRFVGIVQDVISSMNTLTLNAQLVQIDDQTRFKMNSNLDDRVSQELQRLGSKALADAQNKVRSRLNAIRDQKLGEVNAVYAEKEKEIVGKIEYYEEKVEEQRLLLEAKVEQLLAKLETRKKQEENKAKQKAKNLLDNVIK